MVINNIKFHKEEFFMEHFQQNIVLYIAITIFTVFALLFIKWILSLRVVVPTNMVHIVQKSNRSVPYGRGKEAGNVYFLFPSWIPFIGITVTQFQESIFQVTLKDYDAYDSNRLPFMIDVTAFFKVADAETVAQRVANFSELESQLLSILQGAVRRILATSKLEDIMQERSSLGDKFTEEVKSQVKEWGVESVKTIEFMDIRDAKNSSVIANIMSKEQSRIEKDARIAVAENLQVAKTREIEANRVVEVNKQTAEKQVGIANAEKEREIGIAQEQSQQQILDQQKATTEKTMEVQKVKLVKQAEIDKEVAIVEANKSKEQLVINSDADLYQAQKNSEAILKQGEAKATSERLMLEAPVEAQIKLAKEIGANESYQNYLVNIKRIEVNGEVMKTNAIALEKADLKILVNSGDVQSGLTKFADILSSKGGAAFNGFTEALGQSETGTKIADIINSFSGTGKQMAIAQPKD